MSDDQKMSNPTRRTVLKAGGAAAIAGLLSPGHTIAQEDLPLEIEQNAEDEYVIIRNVGDEEVDITGYSINFEAGEDSNVDQIRELDGEVVIGPGEEVTVATGEQTTIDVDVELADPYEGFVLNNEDPDVVALLDEDENIVATSEGEAQDEGDEEEMDDDEDEDDVDPGEDDEEDPGAGEDPGDDDDEDPGDRGDEDQKDEDEAAADDEEEEDDKDEKDEKEAEDKKDDDCPNR